MKNTDILHAFICVLLIMYATLIKPQLPLVILHLFDNTIFRIGVLTLVNYMANINLSVSILIAIVFLITFNLLKEQSFTEGFEDAMNDPQEPIADKDPVADKDPTETEDNAQEAREAQAKSDFKLTSKIDIDATAKASDAELEALRSMAE